MRDRKEFHDIITRIDGQPFSEYNDVIGDYDFTRFILKITEVPDHPDGEPSFFLINVPPHVAGFPDELYSNAIRRTALEDLLIRKVAARIDQLALFDSSGVAVRRFALAMPTPQILPRSALSVSDEGVELRIQVFYPHTNGNVDAETFRDILFDDLPDLIDCALVHCNLDPIETNGAVDLMEEADQIRQALTTQGLVAFIANGTTVERATRDGNFVQFTADETVLHRLDVPDYGEVDGIGIPSGITLILGAENQGRQELVSALACGIYNHTIGDGRARCVTVPDAVYVAGAAGRSVQGVDISPFARQEIDGRSPRSYSHPGASAFAAQAASLMEALMAGARVLLFDESDSAPGFLAGDSRIEGLTPALDAGRIPLARRAREIVDTLGASLVIAGACGVADLIPVADTILAIEDGRVMNITESARRCITHALPAADPVDLAGCVDALRWIIPGSIDPSIGIHDARSRSATIDTLCFGRSIIDLVDVAQIVDSCQTETIGLIMEYAKQRYLDQPRPLREVLDLVDRDLSTEGLECLTRDIRSDLARPRRYEIAAAFCRLGTLRVSPEAI